MNIKLCLVVSLLFGITTAQTVQEQKKIIASYDSVKTVQLLNEINNYNASRVSRVNNFLTANPNVKLQFKKDGILYKITDVIDGKSLLIATDNAAAGRAIGTPEYAR